MGEIKHLLPRKKYYKTNLHTHSNISDGHLSPEEVKDLYKAKGYSIVALTDHSVVSDQQHLNDEDFLFLTGVEIDVKNHKVLRGQTCHMNLIFRDPHKLWVPVHDSKMLPRMEEQFKLCQCEEMPEVHTPEGLNAIIQKSRENGALVIFNHPEWSCEYAETYTMLEGLWGFEYRNSTCALKYAIDTANEQIYREMQHVNPDIVPVMADDMHGSVMLGKSWNMVAAEELTYDAVMDALENKELYASCGPELYEVSWDGSNLHVSCSPAASIRCIGNNVRGCRICFAPEGEEITEATFDLSAWAEIFAEKPCRSLRVIVTARDGSYATTRTYTEKDF